MTTTEPTAGAAARIAGAPISWGVCEVPGWGYQLEPDRVLAEMAGLGLPATELGPDGYLPTDPSRLEAALADHGLGLAAGFVPAVLHEPAVLEEELERVSVQADLLAASGADVLVLAAETGTAGYEAGADLDGSSWASLVAGIGRGRGGDVSAARDGRRGRGGHRLGPGGVGLRWLVRAGAGQGAGGGTRGGDGPGPGRRREPRVPRAIGRAARTIVRGRYGGVGG